MIFLQEWFYTYTRAFPSESSGDDILSRDPSIQKSKIWQIKFARKNSED